MSWVMAATLSTNPPPSLITDDHIYVNQLDISPTIDIIHYTYEGSFGAYWHTHKDNMKAVSKSTLQLVGIMA